VDSNKVGLQTKEKGDTKEMIAGIYCRVSTPAQGEEEKASIPEQVSRIEGYCQKKGYDIIDRYIDIGYSGAKSKRPEFQRMLADAKNSKFDVIVCWKADRLSRGMYPAAALMETIEPLEIKLEAVEEHLDMNYFAMLAIVGKIELDNLRARTLMGKVGRAKAGKLLCGKANKLLGYDYDDKTGKRVINRDSEIVQSIFYSYAEEHLPIQTICRRLMAQGILSPSGNKHWGNSTIHKILTNEAYIGHTFAFTQRHIKGDKIHVQYKPREDWIEIPDSTPAIIDETLFKKAQYRLQRNKELALRNTKRDYLLRGFAYCNCGWRYQGTMKRYQTKDGIKEYLYYRCSSAFRPLAKPCDSHCWKAEELESIVWEEVSEVLAHPEVVLAGLEAIKQDDANLLTEELRQKESQLKALDEEQYALLDQSLRGFPEEIVIAENKKINANRNELTKQKVELETRIQAAKQAEADMEGIKQACDIVRDNLLDLTFEKKRMALEALNVRVRIDNDKVNIEGTIPMTHGTFASIPSKRNGERMPSISARQLTQSGQSIPLG